MATCTILTATVSPASLRPG